jgi:hypothetical protein
MLFFARQQGFPRRCFRTWCNDRSGESFSTPKVDLDNRWLARTDDRANDRGAIESVWTLSRSLMSVLMMSVALNIAVVIVLFAAAVLMTLGMLGMH